MKKVVLLSGGVDSSTCLAMAVAEYGRENVIALLSPYGQKHIRELSSAKAVAEWYGVETKEIDLTNVFRESTCPLLAKNEEEVEKTSYAEQTQAAKGKPVKTYVPFRNGVFLSAAAALAVSVGADEVWYGAHKDDAAGEAYPDCSGAFVRSMGEAIQIGTGGLVKLRAPFVGANKAGVVKKGLELGVPYELTWSCYEGGEKPCGKCGTCRDRRAAFEANGAKDPLEE